MIQAPNYLEAFEAELCRYLSGVLFVSRHDISVNRTSRIENMLVTVEANKLSGTMVLERLMEAKDKQNT